MVTVFKITTVDILALNDWRKISLICSKMLNTIEKILPEPRLNKISAKIGKQLIGAGMIATIYYHFLLEKFFMQHASLV